MDKMYGFVVFMLGFLTLNVDIFNWVIVPYSGVHPVAGLVGIAAMIYGVTKLGDGDEADKE